MHGVFRRLIIWELCLFVFGCMKSPNYSDLSFFLNQLIGLSCALYLEKSSLPTRSPPAQKEISMQMKQVVDQNTFCLVSSSRKGTSNIRPKKTPLKSIRKIPILIWLFFFFIVLIIAIVATKNRNKRLVPRLTQPKFHPA